MDVNTREKGDNPYAMHWARLLSPRRLRRLADAGGDVVGHGDDTAGGDRLGNAWDGCDDTSSRHRRFFVSRARGTTSFLPSRLISRTRFAASWRRPAALTDR